MSEPVTLILDASGTVDRVAIGSPADVAVAPGEVALAQADAPAGVWIGWKRKPDGTFGDPRAAAPPTKADLVAYTKAARAALVDSRTIPVVAADGVEYPLPIEIQTRPALTAGRVQISIKPDYKIRSWTFLDGRVKVLEGPDIITFSDAADAAFQHVFDQQALCLAGIMDGSVTTPAQIDAILVG